MKDPLLINKFISIFEDHLDFVKTAKFPKYSQLYKKIICFGILDTLSKTVNITGNNRERMCRFLTEFAPDPLWEKISISHLDKFLANLDSSKYRKLVEKVSKEMRKHDSYCQCNAIDFTKKDLFETWPTLKQETIKLDKKIIHIDFLKHKQLFYNYRNYLIHELRRPSTIYRDKHDHEFAYYEILIDFNPKSGKTYWELGYPLGFFVKICESILKNTKEYLKKNSINPYSKFERTDFLVKEFNQRWF